MTYKQGGATAKEAADHCGLTVQATRRIAKELAENKRGRVRPVLRRFDPGAESQQVRRTVSELQDQTTEGE